MVTMKVAMSPKPPTGRSSPRAKIRDLSHSRVRLGTVFEDADDRRRLNFTSGAALALNNFGDFLLFKDSAAAPLLEGRFDPDWKLNAADANKLAASGVVLVKPGFVK